MQKSNRIFTKPNFLLSIDEIYYVENNDYLKAIKVMQNYKHNINYSDCLTLLSMVNNNIDTIISFDSDFDRLMELEEYISKLVYNILKCLKF